ncbi:MAG: SDR family oxidoreductase [Verrucomicrobiota bacterium]
MSSKGIAIIGATGGIGTVLTQKLHNEGVSLFLGSRNEEALSNLANKTEAPYQRVDATNWDEVDHFIKTAQDKLENFYGLVLCVGSIILKPAHLTTQQEFEQTINLNLSSAFATIKFGAKAMMQNGGSIVLLSSAAARKGLVNHEAIAAAKAGVIGLTQSSAATYSSYGVRINCVAPGLVDTPMASRITSNEASLKASEKMHPLGRIGKPEDVASAIAWFLNSTNSWVTGQVLGIDGGLADIQGRR